MEQKKLQTTRPKETSPPELKANNFTNEMYGGKKAKMKCYFPNQTIFKECFRF